MFENQINKIKLIAEVTGELLNGRSVCVPVESSNVICWHYNPFTKSLSVLFGADRKKHTTYKYKNVGLDIVFKLLLTESVGRTVNRELVNKFDFTKLDNKGVILS